MCIAFLFIFSPYDNAFCVDLSIGIEPTGLCPFGKHAQMKNNFIFFEGDAMPW